MWVVHVNLCLNVRIVGVGTIQAYALKLENLNLPMPVRKILIVALAFSLAWLVPVNHGLWILRLNPIIHQHQLHIIQGVDNILLQTATVHAFNLERPDCKLQLNVLMDSGSQSSYITMRACKELGLRRLGRKPMSIMTFGNKKERQERCDIVNLGVETVNSGCVELRLLSVEHICEPIYNSSIDLDQYPYLKQLNLAFDSFNDVPLEIDILLGSDQYWNIMTGEVIRVQNGPTALDTQFGWVLSGPVILRQHSENEIALVTHVLRVDSVPECRVLDRTLREFWNIEALEILEREDVVQNQFEQHVSFENGLYVVSLPLRDHCLSPPTNYKLCVCRLNGLLKRLRKMFREIQ